MKHFTLTDESDYDRVIVERVIIGRITRKRYEVIRKYAKRHTESAPNGRSANGYSYSCGHEHDCCGCLTGQYMNFNIEKHWKGHKVTLKFVQNFNY